MSFSSDLKHELAQVEAGGAAEQYAQLYAMLLFGRSFSADGISLSTENTEVAAVYRLLLLTLFDAVPQVQVTEFAKKPESKLFTLKIEDPAAAGRILSHYGHRAGEIHLRINRANLEDEPCVGAFVRGVFLACGSMVHPQKEYHLEFVSDRLNLSRDFIKLLDEQNIRAKLSGRKGSYVIYIKESEQIEDLLTFMGAFKTTLEVMNIKIYKDLRNKVNRVTNCETANLSKTAAAAAAQVQKIERIERAGGLGSLSDELREIALLRLENPELSLRELGELCRPPVTRSGVNHRLKRLCEIADGIVTAGEKENFESF